MTKAIGGQTNGNQAKRMYVLKAWFWYTIRCMKTRLGRAKSEIDEDVYLV